MPRVLDRSVWLPALLYGLTAWVCVLANRYDDTFASLWFANGLLVGLLLNSERRSWGAAVGVAFLTGTAALLATGSPPLFAVGLAVANSIEVAIALWILGGSLQATADLMQARVLGRFCAGPLLLAPAAAAVLCGSMVHLAFGTPLGAAVSRWYGGDALGMGVIVPLVLALRPTQLLEHARRQRWYDSALPLLLLIATTVLLFSQSRYPLLIVVLPPLLLVTFRLGFAGAALGIFLVLAIASGFSLAGSGPFTAWQGSFISRLVAIQLFTATMILITYPMSAVIASKDELLRNVAASEQRLRLIADNTSDMVTLVDGQGLWRYVSPSVTTLFGWQAQDILGTDGAGFVHEDDIESYRYGIKVLISGRREELRGVFRVRHRDGHHVWVETICRLLRDAAGAPNGWVCNARDISTRKRIEQLKDEFISTVNHELRTPLTAMTASVGLALSGRFGPVSVQMHRLLEMAQSNGERLATLVNDILDFEKVSSGKMQFRLRPHAVDELIEQAVNANRSYAMQFEVALQARQRVPGTCITVDGDRFQQVMSNLLSNAAKFSKRGGRVEVDVTVGAGQCRISVIDRGCGIPLAFRGSLFERFAQADSSDRRAQGGTGLGMAIAKHLTEGMAGSISYESEEGQGTTFHLQFALAQSAQSA